MYEDTRTEPSVRHPAATAARRLGRAVFGPRLRTRGEWALTAALFVAVFGGQAIAGRVPYLIGWVLSVLGLAGYLALISSGSRTTPNTVRRGRDLAGYCWLACCPSGPRHECAICGRSG